ncbi:hypothetical protein [Streptosporangium sp. NPDC002607]
MPDPDDAGLKDALGAVSEAYAWVRGGVQAWARRGPDHRWADYQKAIRSKRFEIAAWESSDISFWLNQTREAARALESGLAALKVLAAHPESDILGTASAFQDPVLVSRLRENLESAGMPNGQIDEIVAALEGIDGHTIINAAQVDLPRYRQTVARAFQNNVRSLMCAELVTAVDTFDSVVAQGITEVDVQERLSELTHSLDSHLIAVQESLRSLGDDLFNKADMLAFDARRMLAEPALQLAAAAAQWHHPTADDLRTRATAAISVGTLLGDLFKALALAEHVRLVAVLPPESAIRNSWTIEAGRPFGRSEPPSTDLDAIEVMNLPEDSDATLLGRVRIGQLDIVSGQEWDVLVVESLAGNTNHVVFVRVPTPVFFESGITTGAGLRATGTVVRAPESGIVYLSAASVNAIASSDWKTWAWAQMKEYFAFDVESFDVAWSWTSQGAGQPISCHSWFKEEG